MGSNRLARYFPILSGIGLGMAGVFFFCTFLLGSGFEEVNEDFRWPPASLSGAIVFIRNSGSLGILASIGIMVVHSFVPFPAELVAIANGMVYGSLWGTVITWVGAMLGALLAFGLARRYGRPFVGKILSRKNAQRLDAWVAQHGTSALFLSRFVPVISFNLINYAAGLLHISWLTFAWTTGVGILPVTILMVVMGEQFNRLPLLAWVLILCGGMILWFLGQRFAESRKGDEKRHG
jgi:uncharacterized membrane protein YdjX (TVP38/TMEM64 family)